MNAAKAGATAALVWAAVEPFDQRMLHHDYSDVAVLGKAGDPFASLAARGPGHARGERRRVWSGVCADAEARHFSGDHGARRAHRPLSARRDRRSPPPRARDEGSRAAVVEACVRASDLPAPALRRAARAPRGLTGCERSRLGQCSGMTPERPLLTWGLVLSDNSVMTAAPPATAVLARSADRGSKTAGEAEAAAARGRVRGGRVGRGWRGVCDSFGRVSGGGPRPRQDALRTLVRMPATWHPPARGPLLLSGDEQRLLCLVVVPQGAQLLTSEPARHGTARTADLFVPEAIRAVRSASLLADSFVGRGGGQLRESSSAAGVPSTWMWTGRCSRLRAGRIERAEHSGQRESGVPLAPHPRSFVSDRACWR